MRTEHVHASQGEHVGEDSLLWPFEREMFLVASLTQQACRWGLPGEKESWVAREATNRTFMMCCGGG